MNAHRLFSCEGKSKFPTYALANEARHRSRSKVAMNAYKCKFCGQFHVGRAIPKALPQTGRFDWRMEAV